MTTKPLSVECKHGTLTATVVCRHHVTALDRVVGFVENSSHPNDLQAWCDECEAYFSREGELTEAFQRFNDFAVVCVACYSDLKAKHARGLEDSGTRWPFSDPKDLAVFTLEEVLTGQQPVLEVHHQVFDGSWQFLTGSEVDFDNGRLVRLVEVVAKDPTLEQVADLPLGWCAERASERAPWQRRAVFSSNWDELLTEAQLHTQECVQRLESEFFLLEYERYDYDQESATLVFSAADRPNLTMNIQVIGSWAAESGTWLWAWENDSILASAKEHVHVLKKLGEQNGFERLTEALWEATQADAWEMTRLACLLLQADGIYRAPDEDGALFMVVSDPEFVEQ
jgi:hypothetical protein